jgi:hypothetical protein
MTPRQGWPEEAKLQLKRALRIAQQSIVCIDALQRHIEQHAVNEALLQLVRLQNLARQIELEMAQARSEALRWGRRAKETRAFVRDLAQTIIRESAVLKRNINEGVFDEALLELAEQQGRVIDILVLLVTISAAQQ